MTSIVKLAWIAEDPNFNGVTVDGKQYATWHEMLENTPAMVCWRNCEWDISKGVVTIETIED